ncbi:MAG: hypothetical protein V4641_16405 [Pseudomonadota bacterium]
MDAKIRWDETSAEQFGDLADNVVHNAGEAFASATEAGNQAIGAANYAEAAQGSAGEAAASAAEANQSATNAANSAVASQNNATGIIASSTSSVAIGAGDKVFTIPAGKQFLPNVPMVAASPIGRVFGTLKSYVGPTLTIAVTKFEGTGNSNDWSITTSGGDGPPGGTLGGSLVSAVDEKKGTSVTVAATIDPWSTGGNLMDLIGDGLVNALANAPQPGSKRTMIVRGYPVVASTANMQVDGGTAILSPEDKIDITADTVTKSTITIRRKDGTATPTAYRNTRVVLNSTMFVAEVDGPHRLILSAGSGSGGVASQASGVGGAAASGGSPGGLVIKHFNAVAGNSYMLMLGARGLGIVLSSAAASVNVAAPGNDAADSTFTGNGLALVAGGGKKGNATIGPNAVALGAIGGTASGGDYNFAGASSGTATAINGASAATGGVASNYKGKAYSSGNATSNRLGVTAASGGAGVGGSSGSATVTAGGVTAGGTASSGGGYLGSSADAIEEANTVVGVGASTAFPVVIAPIKLGGAGTAALIFGSSNTGLDGGGSGGVAVGSGVSTAISGPCTLLGGSGGVAGSNGPNTSSYSTGAVTYGGSSGGIAHFCQSSSAPALRSGDAGAAFAIIESK